MPLPRHGSHDQRCHREVFALFLGSAETSCAQELRCYFSKYGFVTDAVVMVDRRTPPTMDRMLRMPVSIEVIVKYIVLVPPPKVCCNGGRAPPGVGPPALRPMEENSERGGRLVVKSR